MADTVKPLFQQRGNAIAFAVGQEIFERDGVSPELRRVVRLSLESERRK
jgi:hypothetical protein